MAEKFNRATFTRSFLRHITRIKAPDEMLAEAKEQGLEKTLGVWDLIILGVGAIIGSGIFAVVGIAAAGSAHYHQWFVQHHATHKRLALCKLASALAHYSPAHLSSG